jgi:hypothetical protein
MASLEFYMFLATIAIILGACKLFIFNEPAGKGLTGIILIITGLFTQLSDTVLAGTSGIIGYAGYILIAIGCWLIIKEITNR